MAEETALVDGHAEDRDESFERADRLWLIRDEDILPTEDGIKASSTGTGPGTRDTQTVDESGTASPPAARLGGESRRNDSRQPDPPARRRPAAAFAPTGTAAVLELVRHRRLRLLLDGRYRRQQA